MLKHSFSRMFYLSEKGERFHEKSGPAHQSASNIEWHKNMIYAKGRHSFCLIMMQKTVKELKDQLSTVFAMKHQLFLSLNLLTLFLQQSIFLKIKEYEVKNANLGT